MTDSNNNQTNQGFDQSWHPRRLLHDWQIPDFLEEIDFDTEYFASMLEKLGVRLVQFPAKNAFGNAMYPTNIGRRHPAVAAGRDLLGEVCRAVKDRGIQFITYFNVLLDYDTSGERSRWLQRDPQGNALSFEQYPMFCLNSPYIDFVVDYVSEIADGYDIDGIMLDIQYWHAKGCFCDNCRRKFLDQYGAPLAPENFTNGLWMQFGDFQRESKKDAVRKIQARVEVSHPSLRWTWNGSGNHSVEYSLDRYIDSYGSEAHPPAYDACSAKAKWMRSSGKPFELWMPESIGSWGHHSLTTVATLEGMSALALANNGAVTINHSTTPAGAYGGRVAPAVYETIGEVFSWIREREQYCAPSVSAAEIAVLHSGSNTLYERMRRKASAVGATTAPSAWFTGQQATYAVSSLLDASQVPFDILHSEDAIKTPGPEAETPRTEDPGFRYPRRLSEYACLILPNVAIMDDDTAASIRDYVASGGVLIATYYTSLLNENGEPRDNFLLSDVFGLDYQSLSPFTTGFLDRFETPVGKHLPDMPLLFRDTAYQQVSSNRPIRCTLHESARALATITDPVIEPDWSRQYHIFHDHAPPGTLTDFPGISIHRFGKGTAIYLAVPILESYAHLANPWYRNLFRNLLDLVGLPRDVRIEGPGSLRAVVNRFEQGIDIHLMRIQQETGGILLEAKGTIDATCTVRHPSRVHRIELPVSGNDVEMRSIDESTVEFTVPVGCHEIVRVHW